MVCQDFNQGKIFSYFNSCSVVVTVLNKFEGICECPTRIRKVLVRDIMGIIVQTVIPA